jgi:hypothetical protein
MTPGTAHATLLSCGMSEQDQNLWQEHQHPADAGDHAIDQQRPQRAGRHRPFDRLSGGLEPAVDQVHERLGGGEDAPEHEEHDGEEGQRAPDLVRQDAVDAVAAALRANGRLPHGRGRHGADVPVAGLRLTRRHRAPRIRQPLPRVDHPRAERVAVLRREPDFRRPVHVEQQATGEERRHQIAQPGEHGVGFAHQRLW